MTLSFDLKYAWRLLTKSWGYSLMVVAVVALGVGLALWMWVAVAYPQLFRPLGLPGATDWYNVQIAPKTGAQPPIFSVDLFTYQELRKHSRASVHVGAFASRVAILSEGQTSTTLRTAQMSPQLLAGVVPLLGRVLDESDGQPGAAHVVVISYDTWQNYFAGDPNIVGKTARIDAAPVRVVGVMSRDFYACEDFELWRPLQLAPLAKPGESNLKVSPFIALGDGQTLAAASAELRETLARVHQDFPDQFSDTRNAVLVPAHRMYTHAATPVVVMLIFMSAVVFLLGGLNISLVFLARLLERTRELALRTALGAARRRLLWQCLLETAPLMACGLVVGYGLAVLGVRWTDHWVARLDEILAIGRLAATPVMRPFDVIVAFLIAVVIWLFSTLIPAWHITRTDAAAALGSGGKGVAARGGGKGAAILVGSQVAVSSLVLVICGAMVLAVSAEVKKPSGLEPSNVVIAVFRTSFAAAYAQADQRLHYWEDLSSAIARKVPGAEVSFASAGPSTPHLVPAAIEGRQAREGEGTLMLPLAVVSDNYFGMVGLTQRGGRFFDPTDNAESLGVAVVDEGLARRYWPNEDAIGKRVRINGAGPEGRWLTIVGIASAVGSGRPYHDEDAGAIYQPLRQAVPPTFHVLIKLPEGSGDTRSALRAAAFEVDRDLPLRNLQTLTDYLDILRFDYRNLMPIVVAIALITGVITAAGLFGLISRSVAQRTYEVGIRRALGATSWGATAIFRRQGSIYLALAVIGVIAGITMMPLISKGITNILDYAFAVAAGVVLLMAAVVFAASYLPSRRAVALEPGDALRFE
jgi:predicted permease